MINNNQISGWLTAFPVVFYTVNTDINTTGGNMMKDLPKEPYNPIYRTIADVSRITGLSRSYLRTRVQEGDIPYIKAGNTYMLNYQKLIEILLEEESSH